MATDQLTQFAILSLVLSVFSALIIVGDLLTGHSQNMRVMNAVWPLTALWAGPLALLVYWRIGRQDDKKRPQKPFWQSVIVGDTHCGAGCTVGDFLGEWVVFVTGVSAAGSVLWANYAVDFAFAYALGILFQYYSIAPMRGLSGWPGIRAALKADTVSLIAFEVGMFAWMALTNEVWFHPKLQPTMPAYWFMMQLAMFAGFVTAYPANWWLIRRKLKEEM